MAYIYIWVNSTVVGGRHVIAVVSTTSIFSWLTFVKDVIDHELTSENFNV